MCGISGITGASSREDAERAASSMIDLLRHRGPDDAGVHGNDVGSAVAMSRLRIRSAIGDAIPFAISLGTNGLDAVATYNGEIYATFQATGSLPNMPKGGASEAEAIATSDAVDGMFALATLDKRGALTLHRDPFGIKPVYWGRTGSGIAFASELSVVAAAVPDRGPNMDACADCLLFGRPIDDSTCREGLSQLSPGRSLRVDGNMVTFHNASSSGVWPVNSGAIDDPRTLEDALERSVAACLVSDRPVGLALSGGIDSSLIAAMASRLGAQNLKTVSVQTDDQSDGIASLAELPLSDGAPSSWAHRTVHVGAAQLPDLLRRAVHAHGEPCRMTSLPLYQALSDGAAANGSTVLLVGEGADELFLGYSRYPQLLEEIKICGENLSPIINGLIGGENWRFWSEILLGKKGLNRRIDAFRAEHAKVEMMTPVEAIRFTELKFSLQPLLLRADATLMTRSIEGRTPYLHGGVSQIATAMSEASLIRNGKGKYPLLDLATRLLPDAQPRKKTRFRSPISTWLSGSLVGWTIEILKRSLGPLEASGFHPDGVNSLCEALLGRRPGVQEVAYAMLTQALLTELSSTSHVHRSEQREFQ